MVCMCVNKKMQAEATTMLNFAAQPMTSTKQRSVVAAVVARLWGIYTFMLKQYKVEYRRSNVRDGDSPRYTWAWRQHRQRHATAVTVCAGRPCPRQSPNPFSTHSSGSSCVRPSRWAETTSSGGSADGGRIAMPPTPCSNRTYRHGRRRRRARRLEGRASDERCTPAPSSANVAAICDCHYLSPY